VFPRTLNLCYTWNLAVWPPDIVARLPSAPAVRCA